MNHDIEKALDNLEKRAQDIQHYMNIMSKVKTVNVADDQDFQREFDFFYKVRRNAEWRKDFRKEEKEELFLQRNYNGTVRRNRTSFWVPEKLSSAVISIEVPV